MKFRLSVVALIVLLAAVLLWLMLKRAPDPGTPSASGRPSDAAEPTPAEMNPSEAPNPEAEPGAMVADGAARIPAGPVPPKPRPTALAASEQPAPGPEWDPGLTPLTVLENMRSVFRQYSARLGGNPVGTNPEITAALNGGNPRQAVFLRPEDGLRINERGELVDNWGTPFFFHQLAATVMEIHSAGPDRTMWTRDDLVIK